jgi:hypothetical protein
MAINTANTVHHAAAPKLQIHAAHRQHRLQRQRRLRDRRDRSRRHVTRAPQREASTDLRKGRSIGWSAGISGGGWISGGFEVTEYTETGQVANCQGETGDVICVFWRAAYTDYTVNQFDQCGYASPIEYDDVISSPNTNDKGSAYLCGRGAQCKNQGHEFVVNSEFSAYANALVTNFAVS